MDTSEIQKKCEAFLASTGMPGFIILGFQTDPENTKVVYSLKDMPLKSVVKGITHTLNDLIGRI
jgi:4-alpha-glucanotransferase